MASSSSGFYGAYDNTFQNHSDLTYGDAFSPTPHAAGSSSGGAAAGGFSSSSNLATTSNVQYASNYNANNFYVERNSPTTRDALPSIHEPSASDYGGFGFRRDVHNPMGGVGGSGDMPSPAPGSSTTAGYGYGYAAAVSDRSGQHGYGSSGGGQYLSLIHI